MSKSPKNSGERPRNIQEKLEDAIESGAGDNLNQNHNSKKVGLGPNTKR